VHIITADNLDATATLVVGAHGGPALVIRTDAGDVLLAAKTEHVTRSVLGSLLDPGTASTVLDFVQLELRAMSAR